MILIFGSAHLDILTKTNDLNVDKIDRIGSDMSISIGGVGANVSSNLAYLGLPVAYCGVFKESPISDIIRSYLENNGVKTHFIYRKDMSLAGYNAHINKNNEIFSSVAVVPEMKFRSYEISSLIEKAKIVFLDTNLPKESIKLITDISKKYGKAIFIQAADVRNADGILSGTGYTCSIMNILEYQTLGKKMPSKNYFITKGAEGVEFYSEGFRYNFPAPDMTGIKSNLLGAGDAFTSAVLKGYFLYKDNFFKNIDGYYNDINKFVRLAAASDTVHFSKSYDSYIEEHMLNIARSAEIDNLTQVYNRAAGEKILKNFYGSGSVFSLFFIDIDRFKSFNDLYGHDFGDFILRETAQTIVETVRKTDFVIRWGGEEFLVILNQVDKDGSLEFAERLIENVRNITAYKASIKGKKDKISVTISLGVNDSLNSDSLAKIITEADKAMYKAKETGRDRFVVV